MTRPATDIIAQAVFPTAEPPEPEPEALVEIGVDSDCELQPALDAAEAAVLARPIVLVGLMGVGKTTIGKRLAGRLGVKFVDADTEIERAAGRTITEIFADFGELEFRDGEERVIARLLDAVPPAVIATGGGAFMRAATRQRVLATADAVWLRADIDTLVERTARRRTRPLLNDKDPGQVLRTLAAQRNDDYAAAPHHVWSDRLGVEGAIAAILEAVQVDPAPGAAQSHNRGGGGRSGGSGSGGTGGSSDKAGKTNQSLEDTPSG